ncbi:uncharacterized protein METZ01_LOCUS271499, partial [marine metagenome]
KKMEKNSVVLRKSWRVLGDHESHIHLERPSERDPQTIQLNNWNSDGRPALRQITAKDSWH